MNRLSPREALLQCGHLGFLALFRWSSQWKQLPKLSPRKQACPMLAASSFLCSVISRSVCHAKGVQCILCGGEHFLIAMRLGVARHRALQFWGQWHAVHAWQPRAAVQGFACIQQRCASMPHMQHPQGQPCSALRFGKHGNNACFFSPNLQVAGIGGRIATETFQDTP
jgi:hypothetical protein